MTSYQVLKRILDIPNHGGGGKYLGLPEQFGRKKSEMFNYIIDRVRQRTSSWSAKFLSPAGKEIMIKSVALAMPVYSMSCFKLPLGIISEIESLLMRFWWKKSSHTKGIPWVAWKRLQYSKKEGGLGFRDLAKFNDSLLAKQAWRLHSHPDSLFSRVMKARYFPDGSILTATSRRGQSYGWSSILAGVEVLKRGSRYTVGTGETIHVGSDNFLPSHPPRPVNSLEFSPNLTIKDLTITLGGLRTWNIPAIEANVVPADRALLQRIYLPQVLSNDRLIWPYTKSGEYSVRSGYWFLTHDPTSPEVLPPVPNGSVFLKDRIWKLPILPKIKHFLWHLLSGALGTATRLQSRGILQDSTCTRCQLHDESINHVMFTCPSSILIWRLANIPLPLGTYTTDDSEANLDRLLSLQSVPGLTITQRYFPLWLLWYIWKSRNTFIFTHTRESAAKTVLLAQAAVTEWSTAVNIEASSSVPRSTPSLHQWSCPTLPFVKCNFDAGYDTNTRTVTGGWIVRDFTGTPQCWGSSYLRPADSPLETEAEALLFAIQQVWNSGFRSVCFEGDCKVLIDILQGRTADISIDGLCQDIVHWTSSFDQITFCFTHRTCNHVAHLLAKHGCVSVNYFFGCTNPPLWLLDALYLDNSNHQ